MGAGIGLFWTASMAMMATSAGGPRSASGFVTHYVCFIAGTAAGALAGGLMERACRSAGLSHEASLRAGAGVGLAAMLVAGALWRPRALGGSRVPAQRLHGLARLGMRLQAPGLLLVAGIGLVYPLVPLVLAKTHGYSALAVGIVAGAARSLGSAARWSLAG